jgi:hypothetical protein
MIARLQDGLVARLERVRRTTPGSLLVRFALFVVAQLGLLVAWPMVVWRQPAVLGVFALLGLLTAVFPRTLMPTAYLLTALIGWLLSTTFLQVPPDLLSVLLLATTLYLVHTLSALAAVLPYDAIVAPGVLLRWVVRAGRVLLLTGALALFVVVAPRYLAGRGYLIASLFGLALVAGTLAYLARLVRRR